MIRETVRFWTFEEKWTNNLSKMDFSKHDGPIHLTDLEVLKHPLTKSPLSLVFHLVSCLLSWSLLLSCLVSPLLSSPISLAFCLLPLSSFTVSLSLTFSLSLRVMLRDWSYRCVILCQCVVLCVWCGVARWKSPCVHSKRPRACQQLARMLFNMCAWRRDARKRSEWTNGRQGSSSSVLLDKICPRKVTTWPQGSTNGSHPFTV